MTIDQKRKELLHSSDRDLINRILAFPDRERLNRDEEGKRRKYPSAEMAVRARKSLEKDPDYRISDKQKWCMADSFARYSTDEIKVSGIKFADVDPRMLLKEPVKKEGQKTVYSMLFHLIPEPYNKFDKNAVAVYVDNTTGENQGMTKIGYIPAAYVAMHPITESMDVPGTLTDHSNDHFKTISYAMDMDTEAVEKKLDGIRANDPGMFVYRMPFILNGEAKEGAAQFLDSQYKWAERVNDELEYYGVNGRIENLHFEFPGGKRGCVVVEAASKLNQEAMNVCDSYIRYNLETGISSDLKRDGYVDVPIQLPAVNTRERTYFSLQAEPAPRKEENTLGQHMSLEQIKAVENTAQKVWFRVDNGSVLLPMNSGTVETVTQYGVGVRMTSMNGTAVKDGTLECVELSDIYATKNDLEAANRRDYGNTADDRTFADAIGSIGDGGQAL